jgi:hypothetical protein
VLLLSTLHEISPFSKEMKTAIVDYLVPEMQKNQKEILKENLFSKFMKVTLLFNLSLNKINEEHSLSFALPKVSKISEKAKEVIVNHIKSKALTSSAKPTNQVPTLFNLCLDKVKNEFQQDKEIGFSLKPKINV